MLSKAEKSSEVYPWNVTTVLGSQFGDEGKGKLVHTALEKIYGRTITERSVMASGKFGAFDLDNFSTLCIRFSGGENAGHTMVIPGISGEHSIKIDTHMMPSGAIVPMCLCVIGPMCVVHAKHLFDEVQKMEELGFTDICKRLIIDPRCHVVTEDHIDRDGEAERARGKDAIGTTKKGIGPAYADMASRSGVRVGECKHLFNYAAIMKTDDLFTRYRDKELNIVMEGAQSIYLDKVLGNYPYVTSGPCTFETVYTTGLPHNVRSHNVVLVAKAYETRVGNAGSRFQPEGEIFDAIADEGHEFGVTTGRRREVNYINLDRFGDLTRRCTPAGGKLVIVINKGDILEEVSKRYGDSAFGMIRYGKVNIYSTLEDLQSQIRAALLADYGIPESNVRFSSTPHADPELLR